MSNWWDRVDWSDPVSRDCPLNQGLVGWWMGAPNCFGGTRMHDLLNRNAGVLTSLTPSTAWVGTEAGPGVNMTATNQWVEAPMINTVNDFTMFVGVKLTASPNTGAVANHTLNNNQGWYFGPRTSTAWSFTFRAVADYVFATLSVPYADVRACCLRLTANVASIWVSTRDAIFSDSISVSAAQAAFGDCTRISIGSMVFNATAKGIYDSGLLYRTPLPESTILDILKQHRQRYPDSLRWLKGRSMVSMAEAGGGGGGVFYRPVPHSFTPVIAHSTW